MRTTATTFLLFFLLCTSHQSKATYLMGADLAWECLGSDKYRVTVKVYRDCNGVNLSNVRINFRGNCSGITTSTQTMNPGRDITPVCPGQCTRCSSRSCSFQYGIEEYRLTTTIDVSSFRKNGCCDVTISWQACCRNSSITTGAARKSFYIEGKMDICQSPCNNSPIFGSDPVSIICLGRDAMLHAGTYDKDTVNGKLDSLVHSFADPQETASSKISWKSPFTPQKPLSYLGFPKDYSIDKFPYGLHLDSTTGQLMFRPMKLEQTVFAIKVEEYRNGNKIGQVRRDAQVIVIKCPSNNPPVISGIDCSKPIADNFNIYTCIGTPICIDICTSDKDKNDTVTVDWNNGIPDATFTVINKGKTKREGAKFCWTPKQANVGSKPYQFVVMAKDNACPINGVSARIYSIYVGQTQPTNYSINTSASTTSKACGSYDLEASTSDSVSQLIWEWYLNDTIPLGKTGTGMSSKINFKFPANGTYPIKIMTTRSGCRRVFYDSVMVSGLNPIKLSDIKDQVVCVDKRINIPFSASGGNGSLTYSWSGTDLAKSGSLNTNRIDATFHNNAYQSTIHYSASDSLGCNESKSFSIKVKPLYAKNLALDSIICFGESKPVKLPLATDSLLAGGNWSGPTVNYNFFYPKSLKQGTYPLSFLHDHPNFCATDSMNIIIPNSDTIIDAGLNHVACPLSSPIALKGTPTGGTWSGPKNTISNSNEFLPKNADLGNNIITYEIVQHGCEYIDTLVIEMKNYRAHVDVGQDTFTCSGDSLLALSGIPTGGVWKGNFLVERNGSMSFIPPTVQKSEQYTLVYTARDSIGCEGSDTLKIEVSELPTVSAGPDRQHCFVGPKDKITLIGTPSGGLWKGYQLFGSNNVLDIVTSDIGSYEYTYKVSNAEGCSNSDKMTLNIRESPKVDAGIDDTLCLSSSLRQSLNGKPAGGKWLGENLGQNGSQYFAELSTLTLYKNTFKYEFTDNFGCTNSDEVNFYVGEETIADFASSVTSGNAPLKVDFKNLSINGGSWNWNFGNNKGSTQFEPSFTYTGGGFFKVILLSTDKTGHCHSSFTQSITVKGSVGTSAIPKGLISLYPSPAKESFVIENATGNELDFTLYNETGQVVLIRKVGKASRFDVRALPKGYYFYKMISVNGQFHQDKLIVE